MANLINDLIGVLEAQTRSYEELLNMANNKTDVIIDGNLPNLQKITSDEQVVVGQILRLEKKRDEIINDISLVTQINLNDLTLSKLEEMVDGKPEAKKLRDVKEKLSAVVNDLKDVNKGNDALIKQSLELFDFTMNALRGAGAAPVLNNYDTFSEAINDSLFDSKQ